MHKKKKVYAFFMIINIDKKIDKKNSCINSLYEYNLCGCIFQNLQCTHDLLIKNFLYSNDKMYDIKG